MPWTRAAVARVARATTSEAGQAGSRRLGEAALVGCPAWPTGCRSCALEKVWADVYQRSWKEGSRDRRVTTVQDPGTAPAPRSVGARARPRLDAGGAIRGSRARWPPTPRLAPRRVGPAGLASRSARISGRASKDGPPAPRPRRRRRSPGRAGGGRCRSRVEPSRCRSPGCRRSRPTASARPLSTFPRAGRPGSTSPVTTIRAVLAHPGQEHLHLRRPSRSAPRPR